jgi:hypothetical protein
LRDATEEISGRDDPVEMAQPRRFSTVSRAHLIAWRRHEFGAKWDVFTEGTLHVGANKPVSSITRRILLAKASDPALGEAEGNVNLSGADRRHHVAGPRGEGDELGIEAEVGFGEVEGGREVLGHVADLEGGLRHGVLEFQAVCRLGVWRGKVGDTASADGEEFKFMLSIVHQAA